MTTLTNEAPDIANTRIWDAVCETDPKYTKKVNQRGGFTAIDAQYQIYEATKMFGPIGIGWGFSYEFIFPPNDTIIANVTLWHGDRANTVHQCGQKSLGIDRTDHQKRIDEDAAKKSITDGLTKCLSLLGFNADVFLGKFDDNKYVAQRELESKAPPLHTSDDIPFDDAAVSSEDRTWHLWVDDQIAGFKDYTSMDDLRFWHETQKPNLNQLKAENAELHQKLSATLKLAKQELSK